MSRSAAPRTVPLQELERITARPSELDTLAEELAEQDRAAAEAAAAVAPTPARVAGEEPGLQVTVRGKLEPLCAKMTKPADRGWLRKRGDGRFTARSQQ
ncbi:hypothetical protein [Streptomyces phaeochromogenes]|uniref:hypothetical protein n=1 Tax=Streptomyces phaeochromogenes TaxID=1923 RepID=UPI0036CC2CCE